MIAENFVLETFSGVIVEGISKEYIKNPEEIQEHLESLIHEIFSDVNWDIIFDIAKNKIS